MAIHAFSSVLNPQQRAVAWDELAERELDVLVIGAGVTGAGVALDAATRGLRTGLVEARDYASGTSSRSSKLFHGGLRYLEQLNFALVAEALKERELMLTRLAPHLVQPVPFLYPLSYRGWERPYVATGLAMYDQMGGARSVPRQKHLSHKKTMKMFPGLKEDAMVGAIRYFDCQADDARHTMMLARTAAQYGAIVRNSTEVVSLLEEDGRVAGAVVRDAETGAEQTVRAKVVINCTGVWNDSITNLVGAKSGFKVRASKGIHVVVPREAIDGEVGLILRTETSVLFLIPWRKQWLIGTTDTDWDLDLAHPAATAADIDYLLERLNEVLEKPLSRDDILGVYTGLRPLLAADESSDTAELSREHAVDRPMPGLVSIAGGKYTTYRVMAQDAVDAAAIEIAPWHEKVADSVTEVTPLLGADGFIAMKNVRQQISVETGLSEERVATLLDRYGSLLYEVLGVNDIEDMLRPVEAAPDYLRCEIAYAASHEGALHIVDVMVRRTRMSIDTKHRGVDAAAEVADIIAPILGWDEQTKSEQVEQYKARVAAERASQECADDESAQEARNAVLSERARVQRVVATT